jgi:glycosyltransferase involved in cell wall biosynthesis
VIAVSQFVRHHILKYYPQATQANVPVIYRGVDVESFSRHNINASRMENVAKKLRLQHDCPVILLPGRITGLKGHDFLLDALKSLSTKDYMCLFIGSDNNREAYRLRIEEKIRQLGLEGNVRIIANEVDMPALYSQVDIVVSASVRPESFGRVAVEAQSMERLVIATKHGGSCETIVDGKTGWLVEPGNVDELTEALEQAMSLPKAKRASFTKAARSHVGKYFSLDAMQRQVIELYRGL